MSGALTLSERVWISGVCEHARQVWYGVWCVVNGVQCACGVAYTCGLGGVKVAAAW